MNSFYNGQMCLLPVLQGLFNVFFKRGAFPDYMSEGNIVPFHTHGSHVVNNYKGST